MCADEERIAKLVGENLILSPIRKEDIPLFHKWITDMEVSKYLTLAPAVLTIEDEKDWFERSRKQQDGITLSIILKKEQKTIGNTGLKQIDKNNGNAEFGIMIGEKKYWNKGYGTEAARLMIDFAFNLLRLHSLRLKVYEYNKRAIKSYLKLGFKETGKFRDFHFFGGEYHDVILMDILADEFTNSNIKDLIG
jgi:RimJ/RimL family protein N-acetyltransferase